MTVAPERHLRADAQRNLARILEAAREVFAEQGIDAPISVPNRRIHHGRLSAVNREMRLRINGVQARVVVSAASTASALGWPPKLRR